MGKKCVFVDCQTSSEVTTLKKQLEEMKTRTSKALVDNSLATLQLIISKPQALFDPYAAMAALEQLVDFANEAGDERASRFRIILRQCRPLIQDQALKSVLIRLYHMPPS